MNESIPPALTGSSYVYKSFTGSSPSPQPIIPERPTAAHSRGSAANESPAEILLREGDVGSHRECAAPRTPCSCAPPMRRIPKRRHGRDEVDLAPLISLPQHTPMSPGPKPPKVSSSIAVRSARPPAARACHRRDVALVGLEKVQGQVSKGEEHVRQRRGLEVDAA